MKPSSALRVAIQGPFDGIKNKVGMPLISERSKVSVIDRLNREYSRARGSKRSPTVHTLGYDQERAARYPWVAEGYARKPVAPGEFDVWLNEQDWGSP